MNDFISPAESSGPVVQAFRQSLADITQQIALRRAHFFKYVVPVVIVCGVVCAIALVRVAVAAASGETPRSQRSAMTDVVGTSRALHASLASMPLAPAAPPKILLGAPHVASRSRR